jgi:outer membrane lipoprotein SlyB
MCVHNNARGNRVLGVFIMSMAAVFMATTASLGIFSCDASGEKQKQGAIIGAIIGGVIGNRVADDNRTIGTVVGAAAGAAAGSFIGCRLQRRDRDRLAADSNRALAVGTGSAWTNDTGYSAATTVETSRTNDSVQVGLAPSVVAPAGLILMGGRYTATRDVVIKAGPVATSRTIGGLGSSDGVDVLGRTTGNAPWAALEQGGVVIGYVPMAALRATGTIANVGEAAPSGVRNANIRSTSVCRTVTQTITPPDGSGPQTQNVQACVQPNGTWRTS